MTKYGLLLMLCQRLGLALVAPLALGLLLMAVLGIGESEMGSRRVATSSTNTVVDPVNNLATVIAWRAGLIRAASDDEARLLQSAREEIYGQAVPSSTFWIAAEGGVGGCFANSVAEAIVATESYLRPYGWRRFELSVGRTLERISGRYPDWSYGPAQIRPSTLRRIAEEATSAIEARTGTRLVARLPSNMFDDLEDHCFAADAITLAMLASGDRHGSAEVHALRHIGGKQFPSIPGRVEYHLIVSEIVNLVRPHAESHRRDIQSAAGDAEEVGSDNTDSRHFDEIETTSGLWRHEYSSGLCRQVIENQPDGRRTGPVTPVITYNFQPDQLGEPVPFYTLIEILDSLLYAEQQASPAPEYRAASSLTSDPALSNCRVLLHWPDLSLDFTVHPL